MNILFGCYFVLPLFIFENLMIKIFGYKISKKLVFFPRFSLCTVGLEENYEN